MNWDARQSLHEVFDKVARAEHEVRLECAQVVEKLKLVEKDLEQALARDRVGDVDGPLQSSQIAVFEGCKSAL